MKVLFRIPPWWTGSGGGTDSDGRQITLPGIIVRAGSRWPFTRCIATLPDWFAVGACLPDPFFMGHLTTPAARGIGAGLAPPPAAGP
jgi:hypothetical protein